MITPEERTAWRRLATSPDLNNRQIALEIIRAQPKFWMNEIITWMLWQQELGHVLAGIELWDIWVEGLPIAIKQQSLKPFEEGPLRTLQLCRISPHFYHTDNWLFRWALIRLAQEDRPLLPNYFTKAVSQLKSGQPLARLKAKRAFQDLNTPIDWPDSALREQVLQGPELLDFLHEQPAAHQDVCLAQCLYQANPAHRKSFYELLQEESRATLGELLQTTQRLEIAQLPYAESTWTKAIYRCPFPNAQQAAIQLWRNNPRVQFNISNKHTSKAFEQLQNDYNNLLIDQLNQRQQHTFAEQTDSLGNTFLGMYYDVARRKDL